MKAYNLTDILKNQDFRQVLLESDKTSMPKFDLRNVSKEEILKQYYVDYDLLAKYGIRGYSFVDFLERDNDGNYIHESAKFSVNINQVKKELINTFHLKEWQIRILIEANNIQISILISDWKKTNIKAVTEAFDQLGWFCSTLPGTERIISPFIIINEDVIPGEWRIQQFEPKYQQTENEIVRGYKFIYHLSPVYNLEFILKNGFIAQHQNKKFNYPDRLFFLKGNIDHANIIHIGQQLCDTNDDPKNNGEYYLFTVKTNLIPDNIDFYLDPIYEFGIFTDQNIPSETILEYEKLKFNH